MLKMTKSINNRPNKPIPHIPPMLFIMSYMLHAPDGQPAIYGKV